MGVEFTASADRHDVPHGDALYAMANADGIDDVEGRPGVVTRVYVGPAHGQTERRLEVIAELRPPRTLVIFHVMELSDRFRYLLKEGS